MRSWGLTLMLRDGPGVVERYRAEHADAWPEVLDALRSVGIRELRIFLRGRRLFMYMETEDDFDPGRDFARVLDAPRYREWDELMRSLQERAPEAAEDEWWAPMEEVFDLGWPGGARVST